MAAPKPRRPPGRPESTGSKATRPVTYRVSREQRAELEAEAEALDVSPNEIAKRRAFPPLTQPEKP